jgi:CheY-like chemotaxis protein
LLLPRIRPAKERHPDLILSETSPPNGGGFQFLRDIRALGPENRGSVPVIAMTAFAQISKPAQRKNGRLRKEEEGIVKRFSQWKLHQFHMLTQTLRILARQKPEDSVVCTVHLARRRFHAF